MSLTFDFNMNASSSFNLSFLVDVGKTHWIANGKKQESNFISKSLKNELPKNTLFNISSLVFNIESHKEEVLSKYSCFYNSSNESLCIMIEETSKYVDFSRETMMNLMDFAQRLGIEAIFLLIARKNKEYVKLLQGMMTVGFEQEEQMKTTKIGGKVYKVLKMKLKQQPDEIQEIEF